MSSSERRASQLLESRIGWWLQHHHVPPRIASIPDEEQNRVDEWFSEVVAKMSKTNAACVYIGKNELFSNIQAWSVDTDGCLSDRLVNPLPFRHLSTLKMLIDRRGTPPISIELERRRTWTIRCIDEGHLPEGMNNLIATHVAHAEGWHILLYAGSSALPAASSELLLPPHSHGNQR
jgi:hypothetical protein